MFSKYHDFLNNMYCSNSFTFIGCFRQHNGWDGHTTITFSFSFFFFIYESTNFLLIQIQIDYNMRKILKYSFDSSFNFFDFKDTEVIILFVKEN